MDFWIIYILNDNLGEGDSNNIGITNNLETFLKLADEKYKIKSKPIYNEFGTKSIHFEYSVKIGNYTQYYKLIAEPTILI